MSKSKIDLSVVVLNYNSGNYLADCLESISESDLGKYKIEVLVPDNNSSDDSLKLAQNRYQQVNNKVNVKFIPLKTNRGFSAGNNQALPYLDKSSPLVLFLNPDTKVVKDTFRVMIKFFEDKAEAGAATCRVMLVKTGKVQPECHRGFPTPWRGFWHFFGFGVPKLFPKSPLFNGYFLGHLDMNKTHEIEACVGAFLMVRRRAGEEVGWWNEKYEFYGEDLDFCYKLKQKGFKLFYVPKTEIFHYQGISSGIKSHTARIAKASGETKMRSANASIRAMRIFYEDHLSQNYPWAFNQFVLTGIKLMELLRKTRVKLQ